jgi:hypothetical protein
MFFQPHYFVIATLALSLFPSSSKTGSTHSPGAHSSAIYQQQKPDTNQEGTVNIQTTAGTPLRGVSAVGVTVDRSRVRVGDTVRFTLNPASLVTNPLYKVTIHFGDGTRIQTNRTEIVHRYRANGNYKVFASVVAAERVVGDAGRSVPLPVPRALPVPRVSLSSAPATAVAGRPVTFSAQLSSSYPNLKYRFAFGDTNQTGWQDSSQTTHTYPDAGTYQAYVDIAAVESGAMKQLGGSVRKPIQVTNAPLGPVELVASPMFAEVGQLVTFSTRVVSSDPNLRYRFAFGDGPLRGWQSSPQTSHEYSSAGNYPAYVEIGVANNQGIRLVGSAPRAVHVAARAPVGVELVVNSASIAIGDAVTLSARTSSTEPNLKYRFFYGDGSPSSGWQDNTHGTHKYAVPGMYSAYVEMARIENGRLSKVTTSSQTQISVTAAEATTPASIASPAASVAPGSNLISSASPGRPVTIGNTSSPFWRQRLSISRLFSGRLEDDWWKYALLALLLAFVGYTVLRWLLGPRPVFREKKLAPIRLPASVTLERANAVRQPDRSTVRQQDKNAVRQLHENAVRQPDINAVPPDENVVLQPDKVTKIGESEEREQFVI